MDAAATDHYRFGRFELQPTARRLLADGLVVDVRGVALRLLVVLVENHQRLVSRDELIALVWGPKRRIEPNGVAVHVCGLRKALGRNAISTTPRGGYRFTLPVQADRQLPPAAPASACARLSNLPADIEPLIARDEDIRAVTGWVSSHRLVTVLGAGGIGKTRVAKAVASGLINAYANGVWWVDLAALSDGADLVSAIAGAANLQLGDGESMALLVLAMRHRDTLLVLDNCEHLADAISRIARALVEAGPGVRVLATSQQALRVPGEHVYRLDTLAVPAAGTPLQRVRGFGAMQLLEERVRSVRHGFSVTQTVLADAIQLCRELDGIPLAIEMAAAQVSVLGLKTVVTLLADRLRLLRAASRDVPARQQTLRATLEWSHSLLSPEEATALRRLSVFAGSFTLAAARQVMAQDQAQAAAALVALTGLVGKSLVEVQGLEPPRYRLLQTTRMFAAEQLACAGELVATLQRHGQAMAALAEEAEQAYWVTPDQPWLDLYLPDYDDLQTAFDRACAIGDAEVAAFTVEALRCLDGLRGVLSAARRRKEAVHALLPAGNAKTRALLWNHLSWYNRIAIAAVPAMTIAQQAVAAWRDLDDRPRLYRALWRLVLECTLGGNREAASHLLAEVRQLEDPAWPPRLLGVGARLGGFVASQLGDAALCRSLSQLELQLAQQAGSRRTVAAARQNLSDAALMAGSVDEAIALARANVEELQALDQPSVLGRALSQLCAASLVAGDLSAARDAANRALPLLWQSGVFGLFFDHLAWLVARSGHPESAAQVLGCADVWYAANEGVREPNEARSSDAAAALVDARIGSAEHKRLRTAAARLGGDGAYALALSALDDVNRR